MSCGIASIGFWHTKSSPGICREGRSPRTPSALAEKMSLIRQDHRKKLSEEMKKREEKIRKSIRLSDEEAADLKKKSELCGLSETEFIRQLIHGQAPKPLPEDRFWDKMNELYECHSRLKLRADQYKNDPELHQFYSERADELQDLVIKIIERFTQPVPISEIKLFDDEVVADQNGA